MIRAFAIAEYIVASTLFRPEFSHSLDPERTWRTMAFVFVIIPLTYDPISGQSREYGISPVLFRIVASQCQRELCYWDTFRDGY